MTWQVTADNLNGLEWLRTSRLLSRPWAVRWSITGELPPSESCTAVPGLAAAPALYCLLLHQQCTACSSPEGVHYRSTGGCSIAHRPGCSTMTLGTLPDRCPAPWRPQHPRQSFNIQPIKPTAVPGMPSAPDSHSATMQKLSQCCQQLVCHSIQTNTTQTYSRKDHSDNVHC